MEGLRKTITGKRTGRVVTIVEGNLPDEIVNRFLDSIDDWGQSKMRHRPIQEKEHQYFALVEAQGLGERYKIIGYGAMYPRYEQEANWGISMHQDWRGEGIGKAMYEFAEELCDKLGIRTLRGEADADNEIALEIMKGMGYELYGPIYHIKKELKASIPSSKEVPSITGFIVDE